MIDCLEKELIIRCKELEHLKVQTIYFGGGTPSLLNKNEIKQLTDTIYNNFDCSELSEFTIEANPEDISNENLQLWQQIGVNRLSIGLQSFKDYDLKWMKRIHSVEQAIKSVQNAIKSGITNISVDLMYGLPKLTNQEWKNHILSVINLGVKHISAYCLTVEPQTALNAWIKKGKIKPISEDRQAEQFLLLIDILEQHNFIHYEISNFSVPDAQAIHNSNYWEGKPYIGIGPSAHSYDIHTRSWNVRNNYVYMNGIENNDRQFESEVLTPKDRYNEFILTRLRTNKGLSINTLSNILPIKDSFFEKVNIFCQQQLIREEKKDSQHLILLTKIGRLQADRIISELFL